MFCFVKINIAEGKMIELESYYSDFTTNIVFTKTIESIYWVSLVAEVLKLIFSLPSDTYS